MLRAVSTFALFAIPVIGVAVPVYVLVRSSINFRRTKKGGGYIIIKAFGSLAAWAFASFLMLNALFFTFYMARDVDREANARAVALRLIIFCVVYALVGFGLALWSQHSADNEPVEIFPKRAA
ncbi:MAG: hypothetical protein ACR2LZ_05500 [Pyrinomonadaceae bacterium]